MKVANKAGGLDLAIQLLNESQAGKWWYWRRRFRFRAFYITAFFRWWKMYRAGSLGGGVH